MSPAKTTAIAKPAARRVPVAEVGFDYTAISAGSRGDVRQAAQVIKDALERTLGDVVQIGHVLLEVKAKVGHGNWGAWLDREFGWTDRTARNYMAVAERFKPETIAEIDVGPTVLYLLASPSTPDSAVVEVLDAARRGEKVTPKFAKAVVGRHTVPSTPALPLLPGPAVAAAASPAVADGVYPKKACKAVRLDFPASHRAKAVVWLAEGEDRKWRWGGEWTYKKETSSSPVARHYFGHPSRERALDDALKDAETWFNSRGVPEKVIRVIGTRRAAIPWTPTESPAVEPVRPPSKPAAGPAPLEGGRGQPAISAAEMGLTKKDLDAADVRRKRWARVGRHGALRVLTSPKCDPIKYGDRLWVLTDSAWYQHRGYGEALLRPLVEEAAYEGETRIEPAPDRGFGSDRVAGLPVRTADRLYRIGAPDDQLRVSWTNPARPKRESPPPRGIPLIEAFGYKPAEPEPEPEPAAPPEPPEPPAGFTRFLETFAARGQAAQTAVDRFHADAAAADEGPLPSDWPKVAGLFRVSPLAGEAAIDHAELISRLLMMVLSTRDAVRPNRLAAAKILAAVADKVRAHFCGAGGCHPLASNGLAAVAHLMGVAGLVRSAAKEEVNP